MKKLLVYTSCFLLIHAFAFSQNMPNGNSDNGAPELELILAGIGLPYSIVNDSLAVIPYHGENIKSYQVIIQKISDLYIVYSNLTEALPGKLNSSVYEYLLIQNNNFDVVKIGMSTDDKTIFLRADVYKAGTNKALLKRVIEQVANVTNIIGGELN